MKRNKKITYAMFSLLAIAGIAVLAQPFITDIMRTTETETEEVTEASVSKYTFNADSAYAFCDKQCSFGPRVMNTSEHDACGAWLKEKFACYGLTVESQKANLKAYDGTILKSENIIARLNPEAEKRILICAHWDSRPWADNDPNADNHHKPVMGANDGASGVAVMIEMARILSADSTGMTKGIDFICFDAEDYGTPQWVTDGDSSDSWALGAQHWAKEYAAGKGGDKKYEYGILLDMVGGEGARFYKEGMSQRFAPQLVNRVWKVAKKAGMGYFFPTETGGYITDDHIPVNDIAGIPCIDIIAHYPDCDQSSFGPTWHTVDDTMDHISVNTLNAVGQTLCFLFSEE